MKQMKQSVIVNEFINSMSIFNKEFHAALDEAINREVKCHTMPLKGWHKVTLKQGQFPSNVAYEMRCWAKEHCIGEHYMSGKLWVFELEKDAIMFSLRYAG